MIGFIYIITIVIIGFIILYLSNKVKILVLEKYPKECLELSNTEENEKTVNPAEALIIKLLWKRKYLSLNNKQISFLCNILIIAEVTLLFLTFVFLGYQILGVFTNAT